LVAPPFFGNHRSIQHSGDFNGVTTVKRQSASLSGFIPRGKLNVMSENRGAKTSRFRNLL
jgi:hypothetical protein